MSVGAARILEDEYEGRGSQKGETHQLMSHHFTAEEWAECEEYARRLERYRRDGRGSTGSAAHHHSEYSSALGLNHTHSPMDPMTWVIPFRVLPPLRESSLCHWRPSIPSSMSNAG